MSLALAVVAEAAASLPLVVLAPPRSSGRCLAARASPARNCSSAPSKSPRAAGRNACLPTASRATILYGAIAGELSTPPRVPTVLRCGWGADASGRRWQDIWVRRGPDGFSNSVSARGEQDGARHDHPQASQRDRSPSVSCRRSLSLLDPHLASHHARHGALVRDAEEGAEDE